MHCPFCTAEETKVIDSRLVTDGMQVRRRRQCLQCNERFTTFEIAELIMPQVIKRNEMREAFNEEKLRHGMVKALEKRPVDSDSIENEISYIKSQIRGKGEREVASEFIGKLVMDSLMKLDKVAYIRFASVYFSFNNIEQFTKEIEKLRS